MRVDVSKIVSDAAYQTYERRLLHTVKQGTIPHHVAIIMDGNRRFAKEIGLGNALEGHTKGRDKLEEVLEWCLEVGVRNVTGETVWQGKITEAKGEKQQLMKRY